MRGEGGNERKHTVTRATHDCSRPARSLPEREKRSTRMREVMETFSLFFFVHQDYPTHARREELVFFITKEGFFPVFFLRAAGHQREGGGGVGGSGAEAEGGWMRGGGKQEGRKKKVSPSCPPARAPCGPSPSPPTPTHDSSAMGGQRRVGVGWRDRGGIDSALSGNKKNTGARALCARSRSLRPCVRKADPSSARSS